MGTSVLLGVLKKAGGVVADYHGRELVRHFGDPAAEYDAAVARSALFDRSHRTRLIVRGRAPGQMLSGVVTGTLPGEPKLETADTTGGRATYHAVLTPKGKMITDLWMTRLGDEDGAGYLLDVPVAGREALVALFEKVLPPRFASAEDVSEETAMVTLVGPRSADQLSRLALRGSVEPASLRELEEGEWRSADGRPEAGLVVMKTAEVWPEAYSVLGPADAVRELWEGLVADGAQPAGLGVWSTLRVEAGRPVFGTDMTDETIPIEAGIEERAIDHSKGCYTGQEVIVRIRDRGHVNRSLKLLQLGDVPAPAQGSELTSVDGSEKAVGWITSAVQSPKHGGVIALAYVGRGVDAVRLNGKEVAIPGP